MIKLTPKMTKRNEYTSRDILNAWISTLSVTSIMPGVLVQCDRECGLSACGTSASRCLDRLKSILPENLNQDNFKNIKFYFRL